MVLSYYGHVELQLLQDDIWNDIDTFSFRTCIHDALRGLLMPTKRSEKTVKSGIACHLSPRDISSYDNGNKFISVDTARAKAEQLRKAVEHLRAGKLLKLISIDTITASDPISLDWIAYFYFAYNE
jgi:hypothetical protein